MAAITAMAAILCCLLLLPPAASRADVAQYRSMRGIIFSRFAFFILLLSLLYLVQRFWFVRGWQLVGTVEAPRWRHLLQGVFLFFAAGLLLAILDPLLGHFIPRQGVGHWVIATARIWLLASFHG
jgi:hypothetical protein